MLIEINFENFLVLSTNNFNENKIDCNICFNQFDEKKFKLNCKCLDKNICESCFTKICNKKYCKEIKKNFISFHCPFCREEYLCSKKIFEQNDSTDNENCVSDFLFYYLSHNDDVTKKEKTMIDKLINSNLFKQNSNETTEFSNYINSEISNGQHSNSDWNNIINSIIQNNNRESNNFAHVVYGIGYPVIRHSVHPEGTWF